MKYREHFNAIMSYGTFDRMPVVHWATWPETLERWYGEGLPRGCDPCAFLHANQHWASLGFINLDVFPAFSETVYEETENYRVYRDGAGVICKAWKGKSSIPLYLDYTLRDASDWEAYRSRLQPDPARIPADLSEKILAAEASGLPMSVWTGWLVGAVRNWMGVECMAFLMYDAPDVYGEMLITIADLVCWSLDQLLPYMHNTPQFGFGAEDICGRNGPLINPRLFDRYAVPAYQQIRQKLESYGVTLYGIDSDGDITQLAGHWLDAGVNLLFPLEVGVWHGDARRFRREYGRDLRLIGNFDKHAMERGHAAVQTELERLRPLMEEGGYILLPDHAVPPGVSLSEYQWYLDQIRELHW